MARRYEVFDPKDGIPLYVTRFRLLAWAVARVFHRFHAGGLDYEEAGKGWP